MRICFFGESYVAGTGDPTYQGWVGRLCSSAGKDLTAYNCGIRGATSALIRSTWFAEAYARLHAQPLAAIIFSFGTNDSALDSGVPRISGQSQTENTRAILEVASAQWPTLMIGPPGLLGADGTPRAADHAERCARTKQLCDELGVPYFDTLAAFPAFKRWCSEAAAGDGAHPGAGGYAEMAEAVGAWPAWKNLIRVRPPL